jgi:hypothetical protein
MLIRIHIKNADDYMDSRVYVDVEMPCIPRKGDMIWLNEEQEQSLRECIIRESKNNIEIATIDYSHCLFRHNYIYREAHANEIEKIRVKFSRLQKLDLRNITFEANEVDSILFNFIDNLVHIELD